MPYICILCTKEKHLKEFTEQEGTAKVCDICGEYNLAIATEDNDTFQLIKALIRFHYSEWDYNTHLGGESAEYLFDGEKNIFFNFSRAISEEQYNEIICEILSGNMYEDYDKGVSVFSGYQDGIQNPPLLAISQDLDLRLLSIQHGLKTKNYFDFEYKIVNYLKQYITVAETTLPRSFELFRARVGFKEKKRKFDLGFEAEYHYAPYKGKDITAPPPNLAGNGRVNRQGVSYLYCATDKYTAISEVRPHPQDRVSLAKFELTRDLKLYDLSESKLLHFYENDKLLDSYNLFHTLGALLNKPIPPSDQNHHYSITQLIADCIRKIRFDGIMFSSTVGEGKNIVLFRHTDAEEVEGKNEIMLIEKVKYHYTNEKLVNADDEYA